MNSLVLMAGTVLVATGFTVLLYLPTFLEIHRVRRELKLEKARLQIIKCAARFQQYLADKRIVCGTLVHDYHYEAINAAQYFDDYLALFPLVMGKRERVTELCNRINKEIKGLPPEIGKLSDRFLRAYAQAARYRHPFKYRVLYLFAAVRLILQKLGEMKKQKESLQPLEPRLIYVGKNPSVYAYAAVLFIAIGLVVFDHNLPNIEHHALTERTA